MSNCIDIVTNCWRIIMPSSEKLSSIAGGVQLFLERNAMSYHDILQRKRERHGRKRNEDVCRLPGGMNRLPLFRLARLCAICCVLGWKSHNYNDHYEAPSCPEVFGPQTKKTTRVRVGAFALIQSRYRHVRYLGIRLRFFCDNSRDFACFSFPFRSIKQKRTDISDRTSVGPGLSRMLFEN